VIEVWLLSTARDDAVIDSKLEAAAS
jgi:hypothetical protein